MSRNKKRINKHYVPKHIELFDESKLEVETIKHMRKVAEDVFTFPFFSEKLCDSLVAELENFKKSGLEHSRPNSMNKQGVILEEVGLGKVVEAVREAVEEVARAAYPDLVSPAGLDSAKAFTVEYSAEEETADKDLSTHFDNSEVVSCFVLSCLVLSCLMLICLTMSYLVLSRLVFSCLFLSRFGTINQTIYCSI